MDLTPTIVPKSDQLNADDLIAGPVTVTVVEVTKGNPEQPVNVVTKEFGPKRPYKPAKSMRRVMVEAWGKDSTTYTGRMLTLFRDPHVKFGGEEVGGIRISAMSHLEKPLSVALTVTRGKRQPFTIQPLGDDSGRDWLDELEQTDEDLDLLRALGTAATKAHAPADVVEAIRDEYKRVAALGSPDVAPAEDR